MERSAAARGGAGRREARRIGRLTLCACLLAIVPACKSKSERRMEALAAEEERRLAAIHAYMVEKTGKDCPEVSRDVLLMFECLKEGLPERFEARHANEVREVYAWVGAAWVGVTY